ncbi:hypothetical protein COCNU_scaffold005287G000010 [Cocos nucifera]|nr:hypothetical protein [Cocos nucifera]
MKFGARKAEPTHEPIIEEAPTKKYEVLPQKLPRKSGTKFGASVGLSLSLIITGSLWLYWLSSKRKLIKMKAKFFLQNGGLFLQQQILSQGSDATLKIFSIEKLKKATNSFKERQILGRGGYGTVYKDVLPSQKVVAIKKSKLVDESPIEQFIDEITILSQINHKNVVKLLGCCLETQVPLLVHEFISNGTLFHHIHVLQAPWLLLSSLAYLLLSNSSTFSPVAQPPKSVLFQLLPQSEAPSLEEGIACQTSTENKQPNYSGLLTLH